MYWLAVFLTPLQIVTSIIQRGHQHTVYLLDWCKKFGIPIEDVNNGVCDRPLLHVAMRAVNWQGFAGDPTVELLLKLKCDWTARDRTGVSGYHHQVDNIK